MLIADVDGKSGQSAAGDLPRVVLLGKDCADEPSGRSPIWEDAQHLSSALGLLVEAVLRVVRPDLPPVGQGEGSEGEESRAHVDQQFGGLREALVEHANHGPVFRVYLLGRQLLTDRPHDGRHLGLAQRRILKSRLGMKWVRQRCHEAPAKTVAVASFSPRWASEATRPASRVPPLSGPYRATAHASPHSLARAVARGVYQLPHGIAHTGMGNARMQGQQSQGRTGEGTAIFGGRPVVSIPPSGGGGPPQRAFAGAIGTKGHSPPLNARYGHPRATSIVGLTSPLATKARNIARCIGQRGYGRRRDLLLGL